MTRLYVCGPVTGHADLNRPAFEQDARELEAAGYDPLVPHSFVPPDATWRDAMELCLERIPECDGLALLPGWDGSDGATAEVAIASSRGIPALPFTDWISASALNGTDTQTAGEVA